MAVHRHVPAFIAVGEHLLENLSVDMPEWSEMVTGLPNPLIQKGFIPVSETPGLGFFEPNEELVRKYLDPDQPGYLELTDSWDKERSWNRLRS